MNPENLYFIDTPLQIQEEYYENVLEQLQNMNISEQDNIYLVLSPFFNALDKGFFKGYIFPQEEKNKDFNNEPQFLIFIQ